MIRWGTAAPGLDESWPVRYRFESQSALQRHLRVDRGFLLPDGALPDGATRVIVEIALPESVDRPLLHGKVRERNGEGLWLDLPMARPAARWTPDPGAARRRSQRVACDLYVEVHPDGTVPLLCRALDLSEHGVRLGTSLETGVRGESLRAVLLSADGHLPAAEISARVVWAAHRETGLELIGECAELRALLAVAASRWHLVREWAHDPDCPCAQGAAIGQRQP